MATFPVDDLISEVEEIGEIGVETFEKSLFLRLAGAGLEKSTDKIKDDADPRTVVTKVDNMSHQAFRRFFEDLPGLRVVAEEGQFQIPGHKHDFEDYTAVIDDWDGSMNGQKGCSLSAISVAVDFQNRPFLGIWHNPYRGITLVIHDAGGANFTIPRNVIFRKKRFSEELDDMDCSHDIISFSSPPAGATKLSKVRIAMCRGNDIHRPEELITGPLSRLRSSVMDDPNYCSSVYSLMSVAMGMIDGYATAGHKVWDLWGARIFFNALNIPYVFMEPWTYKIIDNFYLRPDPKIEYAFACANNETLFQEMMEKIKGI